MKVLYQLEVKYHLVRVMFNPAGGWRVTVHVDPMEEGKGPGQGAEKRRRTRTALKELRALGVGIGPHDLLGTVDIVAEHPTEGRWIVEVEGQSGRSKDQALYSAIGQLALAMNHFGPAIHYGLAVPSDRAWRKQLAKLPVEYRKRLGLTLFGVATIGVTGWRPEEELVELGRG